MIEDIARSKTGLAALSTEGEARALLRRMVCAAKLQQCDAQIVGGALKKSLSS